MLTLRLNQRRCSTISHPPASIEPARYRLLSTRRGCRPPLVVHAMAKGNGKGKARGRRIGVVGLNARRWERATVKTEKSSKSELKVGEKLESNTTSTGVVRKPHTVGVQSATDSHDLPSPAVAVRNLTEQVRVTHLCTIMSRMHHRRAGYPFGSIVDCAMDGNGFPIFSLSPLAMHARNLMANPHCSMVVQMPGWKGLANARVTIFGDVYPLPQEHQELAREIFRSTHSTKGNSHQWGNFMFFRMDNISDIYFVGGFGTVQWVDVEEYVRASPDAIVSRSSDVPVEQLLSTLNQLYGKQLVSMMRRKELAVEDCEIVSIDKQGADVRLRQSGDNQNQVVRLRFRNVVHTMEEAVQEVKRAIDPEDAV